MSRRICLALAATTALLALATAPSASAASEPPTVGAITTTMSGMPSHLAVGGTFEPTFTISSTSADRVKVLGLCMGMWNMAQAGFAQSKGISILWQDPSSGAWAASSYVDPSGTWTLDGGSAGITTIPPHGTLKVRVRITMTGAAKRGTEHVLANGVCSYAIIDASGTNIPGVLDDNTPQTTFAYGSSNSGRTTTPTQQATSSYTASPVNKAVVVTTTPASMTPEAAPSPSPSPSAEQTSAIAATSPAAPSPTGSKLAFDATGGGSTGSGMDAVPLTVTAAALLTFAGAALIIHRRRHFDDPPDGDAG